MKTTIFLAKGLVLVVLAALSLMPMLPVSAVSVDKEAAASKALPQVSISLTGKGILVGTRQAIEGGDYLLTIKNNTSTPRGVEMIGMDRVKSATVRYTKVLKPGKSEAFRWYFAKGKTTYVRDITRCDHDQRTCMVVTFGQMRKAIDVN